MEGASAVQVECLSGDILWAIFSSLYATKRFLMAYCSGAVLMGAFVSRANVFVEEPDSPPCTKLRIRWY